MGQLSGKVAIVTGAGRGIGRAHALALAKEGAAVVVNDLGGDLAGSEEGSAGPAEDVTGEIRVAGGKAVADTTDISDWDNAAKVIETALREFGRVDIIVNNAGISRFGPIGEITRRDWDRTIAVNLTGTAAVSHWAAAHWRKAGPEAGRRIVNTSSGVGLTPIAGNPPYVAAKAAVAGITISSAIELAEFGVRVNAIAPVGRSRISEVVAPDMMKRPEAGFDYLAPENISPLVVYLSSPECPLTGRIFGIVGDDVTVFEGWSGASNFHNNGEQWTLDGLKVALASVDPQQRGHGQAFHGALHELLTPPDATLEALKTVEG